MRWRYYLVDRYGNRTRTDEPVGWDSFSLKIKRHPERHGTFRELQVSPFKFYGPGAAIIKQEYEQYGIRGIIDLQIEGKCDGSWTTLYTGRLQFDTYKSDSEDGNCGVTISAGQVGPLVSFINKFDQKVDISRTTAQDGVTALTAYNLTRSIMLPPKTILFRGISTNTTAQEFIVSNDDGWVADSTRSVVLGIDVKGSVAVTFQNMIESAIRDYTPQLTNDYVRAYNSEYVPEVIHSTETPGNNAVDGNFLVKFRVKGTFKHLVSGSGNHTVTLVLKKGTNTFYDATVIQSWTIYSGANTNHQSPFDYSYDNTVQIAEGENLWLNFFITYRKSSNYTDNIRIALDPETNFYSEVKSTFPASAHKFYLINETASRVIESITNNQLKLYSGWLGRKDSQPYSFSSNGCGSMKALALGLDLRKAKMSDGSDPKLFLSMQDIFDSLAAIDNIGLGSEGADKIRIENWKWFYQPTVIAWHRKITKLEKTTKPDEIWSIFKAGYDKWEAEDYNGLDEFLTKRQYRTAIEQVQNTLEKVCKWIASGYAFEVTRRKQNDTKDWRFDNDVFILCTSTIGTYVGGVGTHSFAIIASTDEYHIGDSIHLTTAVNDITTTITSIVVQADKSLNIGVSGTLTSELFAIINIENLTNPLSVTEINKLTSATNILDPATVYNVRISPERNALRWFDRICQCYRNIVLADKLIFSSGDGNYLASGSLTDASGCKLENGILAENGDISLGTFADPTDAKPILQPERVKYSYPVSFTEYNQIAAQPYGLIYYQADNENGYGWIDEIEYKPEEGSATFLLIPKTNYA